ncbi:dihydrolipoyl dehydrogenase [Lactococcus carnosus]|jgi:dihydrolipoamide dehydrogenase|uniref:dihydrolipoyl dehydrogenase n=1 Tax=Pseudolactococcus carnosus TaxID=2749961 RepID=UPI00081242FA|nr:dihydrolipoyl dehydrogenase [Lactococcus carnosus]SCA91619.1 Dihydrolipoyl dehydrogenase [Lactococcus piscium]MCJ1970047.1 dihydrolipoyl dehydrogenase [Lactococcus carnosus]MCJ1971328.1 dihydrolipoyl dehydrogenase [Lactococcus carnosus]MCJ1974170.1 dihydrolipoyl dehydrogenase [Lactococcus carnosus]MCJ1975777.1 dihydrolipoyl dehydrogenase [Lactococcus carnosus]
MVVGSQAKNVETVVIGSGPGGYVAAIRAAELGQKVTIIERDFIGGVCLNVGCIPSKALINAGHNYYSQIHSTNSIMGVHSNGATLNWEETQKWKNEKVVNTLTGGIAMLLKKHKVEILRGEARFNDNQVINVISEDESHLLEFEKCIIATGSRPIEIPGFAFKNRVVNSTGALSLPEVPKHLVVIGGGVIGSELAGAYANLGSKVTIIEGLPHILNGFDKEMYSFVVDDFKEKGVEIVTNAKAKEAIQDDGSVKVIYEVDGVEQEIEADYCLVSVGRRPNTDELGLNTTDVKMTDRGQIVVDDHQQTSVSHIYAIGDVVEGPMLAHKASYEAKIAAGNVAGQDIKNCAISIPAVAYCDPELATMGETVESANEKNLDFMISKFPFAANGRAITMNATKGFIRMLSDKKTGVVIGAQIAGPGASDLISEFALAIENGLTTEDISMTVHPHPTLGEAIMDTSELADGMPIHI